MAYESKRVVVTGIGMVTPLGAGVEGNWESITAGKSGLGPITRFNADDLPCRVRGAVPLGDNHPYKFVADSGGTPKGRRRMDDFIVCGLAAAEEAIKDSGYVPANDEARERAGVMIGSGIGGLATIDDTSKTLEAQGPRRVSPFFIPASLINLVSGQVSIKHGFKGPNHAPVTACATGAHAIGDAARMIKYGDADVMVAGGAEAALCRLGLAGFAAAKALSTSFNDTPTAAS